MNKKDFSAAVVRDGHLIGTLVRKKGRCHVCYGAYGKQRTADHNDLYSAALSAWGWMGLMLEKVENDKGLVFYVMPILTE